MNYLESNIIDIPLSCGAVYKEDLNKQHFLGPGSGILTKPFQADVHDFSKYEILKDEMQDSMHDILHAVAKEVSTSKFKAKVVLAEPKSYESIIRNMKDNAKFYDVSRMDSESYEGVSEALIATVMDLHRGSIFTDGQDQAFAVGNMLTPSQDDMVMAVQDGWTQRHVVNNLPRQQIIYNLGGRERGERYYGEIMVFPKEMEGVYKDTRPMYAAEQRLTSYFNQQNCGNTADYKKASIIFRDSSLGRLAKHEKVREDAGIEGLILNVSRDVSFYLMTNERTGRDLHFYTMPDNYEGGTLKALRVDNDLGMHVVDRSLMRHAFDAQARKDCRVLSVTEMEFRRGTAVSLRKHQERKLAAAF